MTFDEETVPLDQAPDQVGENLTGDHLGRSDPILKRELTDVDWSFASGTKHTPSEALHPYPAKFIPEIPRSLLRILPLPADTAVLDPFCGSGTTLAVCQSLGVRSVGVDLNPIACLISRVRTSGLPRSFEAAAYEVARAARCSKAASIPDIPRLDHWFAKDVQEALTALESAIAAYDGPLRDALELAFSSIVVRVSRQESDTRYAAIEKNTSFEGTIRSFELAAQKIASALAPIGTESLEVEAKVIEADTLSVDPKIVGQGIGMVITSPPYPNAYEYWLYHKYRMWWLKKDPLSVKAREIGARAHFFKKNHHTAADFARQMGGTLDLIGEVLLEGCFASFVVGRSKIHGKIYDNAEIIKAEGAKRGFSAFFEIERPILGTRKSFNLSHANIKKETILVLRKEC